MRKVVVRVATAGSSALDKRAIVKERILLVIFIEAIAAESQAIGNRVRAEGIRLSELGL